MAAFFITGIGTDVGKTVISAIAARALGASYWKPVQAGFDEGTDRDRVRALLAAEQTVHPELYRLRMAASPHIAAREEGLRIDIGGIVARARALPGDPLLIEGAGGLYVPLNDREFVLDLAAALGYPVILVSRNYLGSINHSLLSAEACRRRGVAVAGWIFNDSYLDYEREIAAWSDLPILASVPRLDTVDAATVAAEAARIGPGLRAALR